MGGSISPQRSWQKKDKRETARIHTSSPDVLLSPLFKSSSMEMVTGALLLRNDDAGRSSSTPFKVLRKSVPPCQTKPWRSCSFLMASSFAPTVFPAKRPTYDAAHAVSKSSLAGRASSCLILSPSQNFRNSRRRLASLACVVLFTAASCVFAILTARS